MRIARFSTDAGIRFGIVDDDELVVLAGDPMFQDYDTTGERMPLAGATLLAPVIPRSKIVGAAYNTGERPAEPADPVLFLKPNTTVIGPGDPIRVPTDVGPIWHEAELAVVIGRVTRQVSVEDALDHVFGYTIANDVTAIDLMRDRVGQAKGYDSFTPIGPFIETELDPDSVALASWVDGEARQDGSTAELIHGVAELVAFASTVFTLLPGDLLLTGTTGGDRTIAPGQTVEIELTGLGRLTNPVIARA